MSATSEAHTTASRAANSKWLERLARAGFIGYGIVHLLFAWLALQIAFGNASQEGDQTGAMQTLAQQPLGKVLLVLIAIGLAAMAIWQALEAAVGNTVYSGGRRTLERLSSAGRTIVYGYLAWTAVKVVRDAASSSADQQQQKTQDLMSSTGGRWLVAIVGLVIIGFGIGFVIYGVKKVFLKYQETWRMSLRARRLAERLGMAGYVAKGVAFGIAGLLFTVAAVTYDPDKARGLDGALRTVRDQSYGPVLLVLVALGIAAFGFYCFLQSRYRKV
jgi:hypothetical protein